LTTNNVGSELYPLWPSEPSPGYLGQLEDSCQADYASRRANLVQEDCSFYHTSVLKAGTILQGAWDLRGGEDSYLGGGSFDRVRVLEVGPASGFFTFHLEDRGAEVVSFEAGYDRHIDVLPPITHEDPRPAMPLVMSELARINNSWWYLHRDRNSTAKIAYGNIYNLPSDLQMFDTSLFGSVLLHLRDPFLAMEEAGKLTTRRMIVTEALYGDLDDPTLLTRIATGIRWRMRARPGRIGGGNPANVQRFAPEISHRGASTIWWNFSPGSVVNMMARLGFPQTAVTFHSQRYRIGSDLSVEPVDVAMFTVVGERT